MQEKKILSVQELEAQTALELPERETPALVTIICLVCGVNVGPITVTVQNVQIAAQVCAALLSTGQFSCTFSA
jgi:hypothetical protein